MRDALAAAGSVAVVWDTGVWTLGRTRERWHQAAASLTQAFADVRLFPLAERANTVGTLLTGMAPDMLPGLRPVTDAEARAEVEAATGAATPQDPGPSLADFLAGDARALYVMGEDLIGSAGDPDAMREQLEGSRSADRARHLHEPDGRGGRRGASRRLVRRKGRPLHELRGSARRPRPGNHPGRRCPPGLGDHRPPGRRGGQRLRLAIARADHR